MNTDADASRDLGQSPIERLAHETEMPTDQVQQIFQMQADELDRNARVKSFVHVLALHRTRVLLRRIKEKTLPRDQDFSAGERSLALGGSG